MNVKTNFKMHHNDENSKSILELSVYNSMCQQYMWSEFLEGQRGIMLTNMNKGIYK